MNDCIRFLGRSIMMIAAIETPINDPNTNGNI